MELLALLRGIPIFAGLNRDTLERIAERCVPRTAGAGHLLFTAGEECRGLYIIVSGHVRIFRSSPEGKDQVLHVEGPGRPVAELPLFDGGPYPASAMTVDAARLLFLSRADFERLYRTHPDIAHAIIHGLGQRLRHLVQVSETLAFRDVAARLALRLATDAESQGRVTSGGIELTLGRSQRVLAQEIGTARESVSRAMKQLSKRGVIESRGANRIVIRDLAQLRAVARGT